MSSVVIFVDSKWKLTSYGNGLAYELKNLQNGRQVFFQGDDAARFRKDLDARERLWPYAGTSKHIGELWVIYAS